MDYEKKYKGALEHARQAYGTGAYDDQTLEAIFPELREIEDEVIRKEMISFLKSEKAFQTIELPKSERWIAYLEKQKEQKPIIQDVELNDAVYDYVRDHFIAGADFTPEYIKKLMENAFFAGVDYYLLKQESESCESDTNVEKVIEDVIRVYGKTQGEWVGGYDIDALIVNLRRAFNKKEQKPVEVKDPFSNANFVRGYESGYNDAIREQKPAEWSEEDEKNCNRIIRFLEPHKTFFPTKETKEEMQNWIKNRLKSLRPSWKPSEEQMEALDTILEHEAERVGSSKALEKANALYEQLQKLEGWKPSEEQIEALEYIIRDYREDNCNATANYLQEILDHLKNM